MSPSILATDYKRAVAELRAALASPPVRRLEQAGCIQYFEFCFELAWKVLRALASFHGLSGVDSPRAALRAAFAQSWIDDERIWLEMLESRNRMAHTYNSDSALAVFARLDAFFPVLAKLDEKLSTLIPSP